MWADEYCITTVLGVAFVAQQQLPDRQFAEDLNTDRSVCYEQEHECWLFQGHNFKPL